MSVQGVILDIDGTLVLSNDAHAHAWVRAYVDYGYTIPFERVRPLIGMGGDRLLPRLTPNLTTESGTGKDISQRRKEIFLQEFAPSLQTAPGARRLVEEMQRRGLRTVVASSATRDELETLLRAARVDDLLRETTTKDDVSDSKPAPDAVQVALEKIGLPPDACVMVGDTPYDIESAAKAGVPVVAVRCGGWDDAHLSGAVAIYADPADLLDHYDTSPLVAHPPETPGSATLEAPDSPA